MGVSSCMCVCVCVACRLVYDVALRPFKMTTYIYNSDSDFGVVKK